MKSTLIAALLLSLIPTLAVAGFADDLNKATGSDLGSKASQKASQAASDKANKEAGAKFNKKLLAESRKNQCSFKSGTAELAPGCDKKSKQLADAIIEVKKALQSQGQTGYKFIVSGHTDSTGDAAKNKELSLQRAQVMMKELISKGVATGDIEAVGMGSEQMLVKPDNTPAKKARNRRYEIQIRF